MNLVLSETKRLYGKINGPEVAVTFVAKNLDRGRVLVGSFDLLKEGHRWHLEICLKTDVVQKTKAQTPFQMNSSVGPYEAKDGPSKS